VTKEDIDFHLALLKATKNEGFMEMSPLVMAGFRKRVIEHPSAIRREPCQVMTERSASGDN